LRRAQTAIIKLRPYAAKLREILQNLSAAIDHSDENVFSQDRKPENILLVVIASNRGLCGAFNSNIIKLALHLTATNYHQQFSQNNVSFITIGRKATEFFRKRKYNVIESHDELFDQLTFVNASVLAEKIMKGFAGKEYDRIDLIYNQFKNAAVQRLIVEQYLPIAPTPSTGQAAAAKVESDYIFEPDKETIVRELIPKTLRIQLFKAVLDSFASELPCKRQQKMPKTSFAISTYLTTRPVRMPSPTPSSKLSQGLKR
jgi:F-type H+-transporting ATPase subunit gamma